MLIGGRLIQNPVCKSAEIAGGSADGAQLFGHTEAQLIIVVQIAFLGLALHRLTGLKFPPVGTALVTAVVERGTIGLAGQHRGHTPFELGLRIVYRITQPAEGVPPGNCKTSVKSWYVPLPLPLFYQGECAIFMVSKSPGGCGGNFVFLNKNFLRNSATSTFTEG